MNNYWSFSLLVLQWECYTLQYIVHKSYKRLVITSLLSCKIKRIPLLSMQMRLSFVLFLPLFSNFYYMNLSPLQKTSLAVSCITTRNRMMDVRTHIYKVHFLCTIYNKEEIFYWPILYNINVLSRGGSLLFLALASGTGNLRKLPVRKRIYLPHFF